MGIVSRSSNRAHGSETAEALLRTPLSRRTLLRSVVGAAGAAGIASILAACGSSSSSSSGGGATSTTGTGSSSATSTGSTGGSSSGTPSGSSTQASSSSGGSGTPKQGGTITLGRSGDSDSLDPQHTIASISWQVFTNIYDPLVGLNMQVEPEGILAEKWEISTDGKQYTFHLRQGIKFHDGTDFNADAVKFTFDRLIDPKTSSPNADNVGSLQPVKVVDEQTVQFTLKEPFSPLLSNISSGYFGILSPTAVQKEGTNFGRKPVGTGPFMFKDWVPQQTITLVRNPDYKNHHSYVDNKGAPYLDSLVFKNIPEAQTQISSFETGEINLLSVPPHNVADFQQNKDYHVFINKQSTGISYIEFNMEKPSGEYGAVYKPPFDDIKLRQAVAYAVNPDVIIKSVLYGLASRNYGPMPIGDYGYNADIKQYGYDYDPDKAKQLLDEAGWTASGGGTRKKNGQSLTVQLWTWNDSTQQQVAQVVQNQLGKVGFEVKLTTMEVATLLGRLGKSGDTSNFDLMGWGWGEPDIMYMFTNTTSGIGYYHAEDYRKLVEQARTVSDLDERAKLYFQASQVMLKDCAMVPFWSAWSATASGKGVQGFKLGPHGYYAYLDAYIEK